MVPAGAAYKPLGMLRFGLAFMVFVHHSLPLSAPSLYPPRIHLSLIAVMVFYALSGFVIAESARTFYKDRPLAFLSNRILKLWPPYLGALMVAISFNMYVSHAGMWPGDGGHEIYQTFSLELVSPGTLIYNVIYIFPIVVSTTLSAFESLNVEHVRYIFVRVAPTLQVEWVFYYIVFGVSLLTFKFVKGAGSAILGGLVAVYLMSEVVLARVTIWSYVPIFLIGVSLAFLPCVELGRLFRPLVMAGLYAAALFKFDQVLGPELSGGWRIMNMAAFLVLLVAMHLLSRQSTDGRLVKKIDQWFGNLSYPFYLNHSGVLFLTTALFTARDGEFLFIASIAAFATSWMMMVIIERPLAIIRDRVRGRKL